jgi:hypothetical protein
MTQVLVTFTVEGPEEKVETQHGDRTERKEILSLRAEVPSEVSDVLASELLKGLAAMNSTSAPYAREVQV